MITSAEKEYVSKLWKLVQKTRAEKNDTTWRRWLIEFITLRPRGFSLIILCLEEMARNDRELNETPGGELFWLSYPPPVRSIDTEALFARLVDRARNQSQVYFAIRTVYTELKKYWLLAEKKAA